ncbi:MAG: ABC transporter permease [Pseudobacteriovorax sp.]|nr:ABC transporter permease [Pseudobacteriovorax sp.]
MIYKFLIKMAFLNLLRSPKRSFITILSIGISVLGSLLFYGYMQYTYWGLSENFSRSGNGHIQIAKVNWFDSSTPEKERGSVEILKKIENDILENKELSELIQGMSLKRKFSGVIGTGDSSTVFVAEGVDPEGHLALSSWTPVNIGENILEEEPFGVVIGKRMAERLELSLGDYASLLVSTDDGRMNAIDVSILGLLESRSKESEAVRLIIPFGTAQDSLQSEQADYLAISLNETDDTEKVLSEINFLVSNYSGYAAKPWHEVADFYLGVKNLNDRLFIVFLSILLLVSVLAMSNTLYMSIMERHDEIGILRSIGILRGFISSLFVQETFLLSIVGAFIGATFALSIGGVIDLMGGIPMPPPPGASKGYNLKLFIDWHGVLIVMLVAIISSALACIFPIRSAGKTKIIDLLLKTAFFLFIFTPYVAQSSTSDLKGDGSQVLSTINSSFPYPKDKSFLAEVEFLNIVDGKEKKRVVYRSISQDYKKIAVAVSDPKGQRMAVLRTEKGVWIQKEGGRLPLRISPAGRLVGEASIGDVLDVRFNGRDYEITQMNSKSGIITLDLKGVSKDASYGTIQLLYDSKQRRLKKIRYHTISGKIIKIGEPIYKDDDDLIDGLNVIDAINSSNQTKVTFLGVKVIEANPDSFFSRGKLNRSTKKIIKESL